MDMSEVDRSRLGSVDLYDDENRSRTQIILAAMDGMTLRDAQNLLKGIAIGLCDHTLDYESSSIEEAAHQIMKHAARKTAPSSDGAVPD